MNIKAAGVGKITSNSFMKFLPLKSDTITIPVFSCFVMEMSLHLFFRPICYRVFLENPIVTKSLWLSMKIRVFMEPDGPLPCRRRLVDRIEPVVSNSCLTPYVSKIRFNITLTSTPVFPKRCLPLRFSDEVCYNILLAC
jgi:hypothetical protein